jgi:hypothetical protein
MDLVRKHVLEEPVGFSVPGIDITRFIYRPLRRGLLLYFDYLHCYTYTVIPPAAIATLAYSMFSGVGNFWCSERGSRILSHEVELANVNRSGPNISRIKMQIAAGT